MVGGIACGAIIAKYRLKWGTYKYQYRSHSNINLTIKEDQFKNQVVTQVRIPQNNDIGKGSGGGDFGGSGRSTIHTSSGGGSFGGGGRKF